MTLNVNNYLNIAAFVLVVVLSTGAMGGPDNFFGEWNGIDEFVMRYQSLLTPAEFTIELLNGVAVMFLGIFTVVQALPAYRSSSMVQDGVKHWFFTAAIAQLIWAMFDEAVVFMTFMMAAAVASFGMIIFSQEKQSTSDNSSEEFWLLRFPFNLNMAWFFAVFLMHVEACFVVLEFGEGFLSFWAWLSICLMVVIGGFIMKNPFMAPCYTTPFVFAWIIFGMARTEEELGVLESTFLYIFSFGLAGAASFFIQQEASSTTSEATPADVGTYEGAQIENQVA